MSQFLIAPFWKSVLVSGDVRIRFSSFSARWADPRKKARQNDLQDKT